MSPIYGPSGGGSGLARATADTLYKERFEKTVWTFDPRNAAQQSNAAFFSRIRWPETGTVDRLAVFCTTVGTAATVEIGVYDTTATTRNRVTPSGGGVAVSAAAYITRTISLSVTGGDYVDLGYASNDGSASFAGASYNSGSMPLLPSGWLAVPLGGSPRLSYFVSGLTALGATISEASMSLDAFNPLILARYS